MIYVNVVVKATPEVNRFQLLPVTDEENPGLGGLDDKTNSGSSIKIFFFPKLAHFLQQKSFTYDRTGM